MIHGDPQLITGWVLQEEHSKEVWIEVCCIGLQTLACEKALRGAMAEGQEKEGELATMSLEFKFCFQFPCGSPSTELSDLASWPKAETSANVNKH